MSSNLKTRGAVVYRLAAAIKFAAFKFLAVTTAIFAWATFSRYFISSFGHTIALVLSVIAIAVMYFLIDKGLDKLVEFIADERINPGDQSDQGSPGAKRWFFRTVVFLAAIRLIATGTTSIWGSYEIADYVTEAPDNTAALKQMESENKSLETTRNSLTKQLETARKTEGNRLKQAKQAGHAAVESALAKHPREEVRRGMRQGQTWYMTTPKLKKYRNGYLDAVKDSARIVQDEAGKAAGIESSLLALNTDGVKESQKTKSALVRVEEAKVEAYQAKKSRRTNFLIIADVLSVFFGLMSIITQATFRAAVGVHSVTEEKNIEGILLAAMSKWWFALLNRLEKLLHVDLDGNGVIGMSGNQSQAPVSPTGNSGNSKGNTNAGIPGKPAYLPVSNPSGPIVPQQPQRILLDVSNMKKLTRKQWERAYTSTTKEARDENYRKALEGQKELEKLGYMVKRWVDRVRDSNGKEFEVGRMEITIP